MGRWTNGSGWTGGWELLCASADFVRDALTLLMRDRALAGESS